MIRHNDEITLRITHVVGGRLRLNGGLTLKESTVGGASQIVSIVNQGRTIANIFSNTRVTEDSMTNDASRDRVFRNSSCKGRQVHPTF